MALAVNFAFYAILALAKENEPVVLSVEGLSVYALLIPGLGILVASILAAQFTPQMKARLVSLRWRNPLPGSFAFTTYAASDDRVDLKAIREAHGVLPQLPREQNTLWYKLYKNVENEAAVEQVHQEYLLTRDLTAILALLLPVFVGFGLFDFPTVWQVLLLGFVMAVELFLVRRAAANHSVRFVCTVLAITSARK